MSSFNRIIRDPLIHFLAGGALIFVASALLRGEGWQPSNDRQVIHVDKAALLKFMQYQSAAFRPDYFQRQLGALSPDQRKQLIDRYVQEEALVREAQAMGLDGVDYVIRQRLVQKMLYLIDDTSGRSAPTDSELLRYYDAHKADYQGAGTITFTHVFIDNEVAHPEGREQAARALKARLDARKAGFDDAPAYGDRFPYLQNYVDRAPDFIANQFGADFARAMLTLQPSPHWQGPLRSEYGWHLVLVTSRTASRTPSFEEVRGQVKDDVTEARTAQAREKAIADLLTHYDVRVDGIDMPAKSAKPAR